MSDREKIVAVGLLTQQDLSALGENFRRAFPVAELGGFDGLLHAIELADEDYHRHLQDSYVSGVLKTGAVDITQSPVTPAQAGSQRPAPFRPIDNVHGFPRSRE
jgi:hypothetical protein